MSQVQRYSYDITLEMTFHNSAYNFKFGTTENNAKIMKYGVFWDVTPCGSSTSHTA
jgi:hypothetical protein